MSSNYPPGVTGNEYMIGGAQREWEEEATCPHCGWTGPMLHEAHYEFGVRAFCANPEKIEVVRTGGRDAEATFRLGFCPLIEEGFIIEMEYDDDGRDI